MSKPRKILPRKLTITLILLAAPLFLVSLGTFFNHVQELLHQEALERSNSILNTTMQRVVNYMKAVENAGRSNAWLLEENFDPASLQAMSRRIVQLNNSVLSCSVSTEPGALEETGSYFSVYSVKEGDTIITVRETDFDYYERAWYRTAIRTGRDAWIDPFSDFNKGAINFNDAVGSYCIPLRTKDGHIVGVVSTDFSFNRLTQTVLASEHPFPNAYYMLLGSDGRYLIHPETSVLFKKTIFSDTDSIQHPDVIALGREMTAGNKGIMHVVKDEKTYHVCYAPVPDTHWSLALVCLDDEILSDYNHLLHIVIIIVIIGLLFITWITIYVVRRNTQPLDQLLEETKRISAGNYNEVIPLSKKKDVVSKLQNSFIAMRRAVVAHMQEVKHANEELEKENEELEKATQSAHELGHQRHLFVGHVLRQIRMPLNIIEGLTDAMLTRRLSESELEVITDTMKLNAARLRRRLLMLYDSSEAKANDKAQYVRNALLPCNEAAQEAIDFMLTTHQGMEVKFESDVPDDLCIRTNHFYLTRSFSELLHNSAKFSDGKHIALRITQTETTVNFIIEDKGPGLPQEWNELISSPFTQGSEQAAGLGLGLPLVKRHITNLGGNLIYDTEYHDGCRIIVEMPKES